METWKEVVGFSNYEVSDQGRVRLKTGKFRKLRQDKDGYLYVTLSKHGHFKVKRVHHLVLEAFVGPRTPEKPVGRHLDGNNQNNTPENLGWGTVKENQADAKRHGTWTRGERQAAAKLNDQAVREIRASTLPLKRLCEIYGVSKTVVCQVRRRTGWAHVA